MNCPYREAIGSLLYLANGTRLDISHAVNMLSRKQNNPTKEDWSAVKRIFRYLRGTTELGLLYEGKTGELIAYADASLGDCDETKRSTTGVIVKLFGDVVYWTSRRQSTVAGSTCEAEYNAMNTATMELTAVNAMVLRATGKTCLPAVLYGDNTAAIESASKPGSPKLKHLTSIKQHYILECNLRGIINIQWVCSRNQEADILTKALPRQAFLYLREKLLSNSLIEEAKTSDENERFKEM